MNLKVGLSKVGTAPNNYEQFVDCRLQKQSWRPMSSLIENVTSLNKSQNII